jgi:hypothetical protein
MAASVTQARRSHQRRVSALLDELEQRRHRLSVLRARGAQPAGLRDLKAELHAVRAELAAAVNVADRPRSRAKVVRQPTSSALSSAFPNGCP